MNYQLIMLPNPILVSDDAIKVNDYYVKENQFIKCVEEEVGLANMCYPKIIAGLSKLPQLDLSLVADEIGYVDVVKLANLQFDEDTKKIPVPSQLWYDSQDAQFNSFIKGFNANSKKYTEEDIRNAISFGINTKYTTLTPKGVEVESEKFIQSLSEPKVYNVEVEMEDKIAMDGHTLIGKEPKITNNTIKVTKIL